MAESGGANIEIAHHLNESEGHRHPGSARTTEFLEILEAIILALVAITTAWSGYQAARWDGQQSLLYGRSSKLRVEAQGLQARGDQARIYEAATTVEWLKAQAHGDSKLAELFERRVLPDFRPAFEAWKKTDPIHDPSAPAGPGLMAQYHDPKADEVAKLSDEASDMFQRGTQARERADDYVRVTVALATVLFLVALSQRFHARRIRIALIVVACLILIAPLWHVLMLPRA